MNEENYKKIEIECTICKAKFEISISMSDYSPEQEEMIKKNLYYHCPVCKTLEELKNKKK